MKKCIFLIILIVCCSFIFCGCIKKKEIKDDLTLIKEKGYLTVGVKTDSAPFGFYKNTHLVGFDIEIAKHIANAIFPDNPDNIKYISVSSQNRISKLNTKEVDILVATMSVNEKRKLVIDFSLPYFATTQKIMVSKNSKISGLSYFNSYGKIAVVMGTTGEKILHRIAPNASVVGARTYLEAKKLLAKKQVDAILGDDIILSGLNKEKNFKIINKPYSREFYAVALRKSDKSKELLNVVNASIAELLDTKQINLIKNRWIID